MPQQTGVQRGQVRVLGARYIERVNAQRVTVTARMGQIANHFKVGHLHGGQHAMNHIVTRSAGTNP